MTAAIAPAIALKSSYRLVFQQAAGWPVDWVWEDLLHYNLLHKAVVFFSWLYTDKKKEGNTSSFFLTQHLLL